MVSIHGRVLMVLKLVIAVINASPPFFFSKLKKSKQNIFLCCNKKLIIACQTGIAFLVKEKLPES